MKVRGSLSWLKTSCLKLCEVLNDVFLCKCCICFIVEECRWFYICVYMYISFCDLSIRENPFLFFFFFFLPKTVINAITFALEEIHYWIKTKSESSQWSIWLFLSGGGGGGVYLICASFFIASFEVGLFACCKTLETKKNNCISFICICVMCLFVHCCHFVYSCSCAISLHKKSDLVVRLHKKKWLGYMNSS